jgi:hypothetical protein
MTAAPKRVVGRPFQKGQSGNPGGRRPAVLSRAVFSKLTDTQAEKIAAELIEKATAGDLQAIGMLWERIEGKVPNKNENGQPGDFDLDLDDVSSDVIRAALKRVK